MNDNDRLDYVIITLLTYSTGMEMVSLNATLGLPVTQGQLYSVRKRCRRNEQCRTIIYTMLVAVTIDLLLCQ